MVTRKMLKEENGPLSYVKMRETAFISNHLLVKSQSVSIDSGVCRCIKSIARGDDILLITIQDC